VRIVGNIPYNSTSEILFWIFQYRDAVQDATLMMQLEVAKRLMARPGTKDYGILSVASQFHCIPRLLFKVSPNSFFPRPDVESAMVQLVLRQHLPDCDQNLFQAVVRSTFGKRRKILRNGLKYMGIEEKQLGQLRFDLSRRPERLSVSEFVELTRKLTDLNVTTDSVQTPFDHEND
jgi:16S rRNA (adenine1518-N6/adenine1519-N6)-dimethyltransferase